MYAGEIVEEAGAGELFASPAHPYTRGLLASRPLATPSPARLVAIEGTVPEPDSRGAGCLFAPRCKEAIPACLAARPSLRQAGPEGHRAACIVTAGPSPGDSIRRCTRT